MRATRPTAPPIIAAIGIAFLAIADGEVEGLELELELDVDFAPEVPVPVAGFPSAYDAVGATIEIISNRAY